VIREEQRYLSLWSTLLAPRLDGSAPPKTLPAVAARRAHGFWGLKEARHTRKASEAVSEDE
jgi:hypothetical protein